MDRGASRVGGNKAAGAQPPHQQDILGRGRQAHCQRDEQVFECPAAPVQMMLQQQPQQRKREEQLDIELIHVNGKAEQQEGEQIILPGLSFSHPDAERGEDQRHGYGAVIGAFREVDPPFMEAGIQYGQKQRRIDAEQRHAIAGLHEPAQPAAEMRDGIRAGQDDQCQAEPGMPRRAEADQVKRLVEQPGRDAAHLQIGNCPILIAIHQKREGIAVIMLRDQKGSVKKKDHRQIQQKEPVLPDIRGAFFHIHTDHSGIAGVTSQDRNHACICTTPPP